MQQITINNKNYPVSFGTAALRLFCREKRIKLDQFSKMFEKIDMKSVDFDTLDDVALLVLCGVKDGLRKSKDKRLKSFDLELEDFYDFLDNGGDLEAVFAELTESMPEAKEPEEGDNEGNQ